MQKYRDELIEQSMVVGALKFGSFVLKSGRVSPYFFNAGLMNTGPILSTLASAYAATIADALRGESDPSVPPLPEFDVLFGPAYKGIPFGACTALVLHRDFAIDIGFAHDRKEAKDHGEGGMLVGAPIKGKRVLILDDVMTAGTAVRGAIKIVKDGGGEVVGVVQCFDREEVGKDGGSTIREIEEELGGPGRVRVIFRMRDMVDWLKRHGRTEKMQSLMEYWDKYGFKG
ncbi:orotate phosphoribosyltransferase [Punctularia strigosozonata HHB-11173 SS5]|uniref:orotate phosphoribosyltransferase n=1 Tax=Punctularia strigosozonata (strain HHB-11173) TaxID=741275 RepID=UPI0004416888|nr:orotate phosphoribosyltransferase [Punctularia strigosozonata HHB-11173 SS5]EIN08958.1 orotate phosphoribosyltransferase [Punctularia strigosozonata HHB-11173 SS5]